jgi:hypothetical protein
MRTSSLPASHNILAPRLLGALRGRTGVLRATLVAATLAALLPSSVYAASHNKRPTPAVDIIAQGEVINHAKTPVNNAIVYLENPKSLAIKSYLTDEKGHFHFTQLSPQTDYEVWAEQNGVESKHKFISQFSSHTHFDFTLELDRAHKHKFLGFL